MDARERITRTAQGHRCCLLMRSSRPGQPGWMDELEKAIALKPDAWKGYTLGDPQGRSKYPWRLNDEKLVYPAYEKIRRAGCCTICIHKELLPTDLRERLTRVQIVFPGVCDVGWAAKDCARPEFRHLSFGDPEKSDDPAGPRNFQGDRTDPVGDRSGGNTGKIRGQERLCRDRGRVREHGCGQPRAVWGVLGTLDPGFWGGPRLLGHGLGLVRLSSMADRGLQAIQNSGCPSEKVRIQAVRSGGRPREAGDLREFGPTLQNCRVQATKCLTFRIIALCLSASDWARGKWAGA